MRNCSCPDPPLHPRSNLSPFSPLPELPTELWEMVVDQVHYARHSELRNMIRSVNDRTLFSCALVCSAWCPRSQRWLFDIVWLEDSVAMYAFAAIADSVPIGASVSTLVLGGHFLHTPRSMISSFPVVLLGKLSNLRSLHIQPLPPNLVEYERISTKLYSVSLKQLPSLPIHRHFPLLLQAHPSNITKLSLSFITFPSFASFARTLRAFPLLRKLYCDVVRWSTLGPDIAWATSFRGPFLPRIEDLWVSNLSCSPRVR